MKHSFKTHVLLVTLASALIGLFSCSLPSGGGPAESSLEPTVADALAAEATTVPERPVDIGPRKRPPSAFVPAAKDTRSASDLAAAACWGFDDEHHKKWMCAGKPPKAFMASTSSPIIPSSWTVPLWVTDPANSIGCASDQNSGTSATCVGGCSGATCPSGNGPLLTVNELIVHRWGTSSPMLQQTTDVWPISSETVGQERIRPLTPVMANAGSNFALICTPTAIGTTFAAGVVTAKSQANPGTDLKIATMPAGAAAGVIVQNQSRLGADGKPSYAIIHSMAGATATMDQPLNGTTVVSLSYNITENNSWTTGDTLQMLQPCGVNLTSANVQVTDSDSGFANGVAWFSQLHVLDGSGVVGNSSLNVQENGATYWGMTVFDPIVNMTSLADPAEGPAWAGCQFNGGFQAGGGAGLLTVAILGGDIFTNFNVMTVSEIYLDTILAGDLTLTGSNTIATLHMTSAASIFVREGSLFLNANTGPALWGAGTLVAQAASSVLNASNGTWVNNVKIATMELSDGHGNIQTTGTSYSAGTWTDGITINPTNLDAHNGGLQNPRTGARFAQN